jgi:hypothetical protein
VPALAYLPEGPSTLLVRRRELRIRLILTAAGRTARGLLEEELLDVVVSRDPPVVRLTASAEDR